MPLLIRLAAAGWSLDFVGDLRQPPPYLPLAPLTSARIQNLPSVSIVDRSKSCLVECQSGELFEPVLFENTRYDIYFRRNDKRNELRLPAAATLRNDTGDLQHYSIDFGNDIGWFHVEVDSPEELAFIELEVFPLKIDYRVDYVKIRDEVAGIVRNLTMTVLSRTFGLVEPAPAEHPTLAEWLSLIQHYYSELLKVGRAISRDPHHQLKVVYVDRVTERARRIDSKILRRRLRSSRGRNGPIVDCVGPMPRVLPEVVREITFDTAENRYLKALLLETVRKLKTIIRSERTGDEDADLTAEAKFFKSIAPEARKMLKGLRRLLQEPFLVHVPSSQLVVPQSMVYHSHPGYAAFGRLARLLNGGLSLSDGPLRIGFKDIGLLYEYWCFLKIVEILRERLELTQQDLIKIRHLKIAVVLEKGRSSKVTFRCGERKWNVVYNRLFSPLPTVAQKPDNVVELEGNGQLHILDAKYRVQFDQEYVKRFGGPGPSLEDINTMHRYRDAIVLPVPGRLGEFKMGVVKAAVVLFPLSSESSYQGHRFLRSIGSVRVGGLPFLPGATAEVEHYLRELIAPG